ncbi:MAG TPA: HPr family phosphocarrier protein [Candidatus Omnitrophota bacterium]|nr:HPr family phosphocarrier protein [Candidatus Omnitrophota bacterium]
MRQDKNPQQDGALHQKKITVTNKLGLHARPAAMFVELAKKFESLITIRKGRQKVDGKSIMGLMTLAAGPGTEITLMAEGHDAKEAIQGLGKLFETNFGE